MTKAYLEPCQKSKELFTKIIYDLYDGVLNTHLHVDTQSNPAKPVFTSSKLTIETVEQGVKYVQS